MPLNVKHIVMHGCHAAAMIMALMPLSAAAMDSHIRTLAASCAACHGYEGKSLGTIPSLAGIPQQQFLESMQHYREMADDGSVMNQHAKGLTWEEIVGLAVYFSSLNNAKVIDQSQEPPAR